MEQEIVDLTNKLLESKNTIDHLEELNVSQLLIGSHIITLVIISY